MIRPPPEQAWTQCSFADHLRMADMRMDLAMRCQSETDRKFLGPDRNVHSYAGSMGV